MAVMKESMVLREAPTGNVAGASLKISVVAGTKVEILEERLPKWLKVRGAAAAGPAEGWVLAAAVDRAASDLLPPSMDEMAQTVIGDCAVFGSSAHFQLAFAHMRSGLKPGKLANGVETGPFGFTPAEWESYRSLAEHSMDFRAADISDWRAQSLTSALRGMLIQNMTAEILKRQPTAAELALALMAGPAIAASAAAQPDRQMDALAAAIADEEAGTGGIDRANMAARFGAFLSGRSAAAALAAISAALQVSLDATRAHFTLPETKPAADAEEPLKPVFDADTASVDIAVSDEDVEALAWVANSEVGHFGQFGLAELKGGLAGVVDTIFNRAAHKGFFKKAGNQRVPRAVQEVINQRLQFSAINKLGTWKKLGAVSGLAERQNKIFAIVSAHVAARLNGQASIVGGATHFLNPFVSDPGPLLEWGNFVKNHAVAVFGSVAKKNVHFHGTPKGVGQPLDYALQRGAQRVRFTGDGVAMPASPASKALEFAVSGHGLPASAKAEKMPSAGKKRASKPNKSAGAKKAKAAPKVKTGQG
jgi:Cell Wall Hydrolase